ncbi:hypothetical protein FOZ62_029247, partial [Perkinsus olseni]
MLGFISTWLVASQLLLLVAAQDPGKYVHSDPGGEFTIMFDLQTDNRLTFVLTLQTLKYLTSCRFMTSTCALAEVPRRIRTLYRKAKIQPGDLTTLDYDEVQRNSFSAFFQGKKLKLVKWSFPLAGAFEYNKPGAFRWRYHIQSEKLVDIFLTCANATRPGGP